MTLKDTFTKEMTELIARHNAYRKLYSFLYDNPDSKTYLKEFHNYNEYQHNGYADELKLQQIIVERYHGHKVMVVQQHSRVDGTMKEGIIEEKLISTFEGREFKSTATFRYIDHVPAKGETLAFWVVTNDKMSTHLYNAEQIELVDVKYWSEKLGDEFSDAAELYQEQQREATYEQQGELDMLSAANEVDVKSMRGEEENDRREEYLSATYDLNGNAR